MNIFDVLYNIQVRLPDSPEVSMSCRRGEYIIRVDWWESDYHYQRRVPPVMVDYQAGHASLFEELIEMAQARYLTRDNV